MIGFLLRSAFWLSLVLIAIPFGGTTEDGRVIGPFEALSSARAAAADAMGICERQPRVCDTGRFAARAVQVEAIDPSSFADMFLGGDKPDLAATGAIRPPARIGE